MRKLALLALMPLTLAGFADAAGPCGGFGAPGYGLEGPGDWLGYPDYGVWGRGCVPGGPGTGLAPATGLAIPAMDSAARLWGRPIRRCPGMFSYLS
jgi:hypothetical protein